jgi:hypothetical protein
MDYPRSEPVVYTSGFLATLQLRLFWKLHTFNITDFDAKLSLIHRATK